MAKKKLVVDNYPLLSPWSNRVFFKKGQRVCFCGQVKGEYYSELIGRAEEDGECGIGKYRIRIRPGVLLVPGNQIYMVFAPKAD